jgi:hypothetical protein
MKSKAAEDTYRHTASKARDRKISGFRGPRKLRMNARTKSRSKRYKQHGHQEKDFNPFRQVLFVRPRLVVVGEAS